MPILFAIVGGIVGAILGSAGGGSLGLVLGAVVGFLLTRHNAFTQANYRLVERIERLEAAQRLGAKIEVSRPSPPVEKPEVPKPAAVEPPPPAFEPSPEPVSPRVRAAKEMPPPA